MEPNALWVLGHRVRVMDTHNSYALVEVTSPPRVPGPPPHSHQGQSEFFVIMSGALDVMRDGRWDRMSAGEYTELPPNTVHTFINNTERDVVWITGWRPRGFEKFFSDFGIASDNAGAREKSVAPEMIERVLQSVERYGMILSK
jgi:quercetin dioxygenase-like cupin family protein